MEEAKVHSDPCAHSFQYAKVFSALRGTVAITLRHTNCFIQKHNFINIDNMCLLHLKRFGLCLCLETEGKSCCTGSCVLASLFGSSHHPCDVLSGSLTHSIPAGL